MNDCQDSKCQFDNKLENEILQRMTRMEHAILGNGVPGLRDVVAQQGRLIEAIRNGMEFKISRSELRDIADSIDRITAEIRTGMHEMAGQIEVLMDRKRSRKESFDRLMKVWSLPVTVTLVLWVLERVA